MSEIYNALQTGVIDGTAVNAFKLAEVANHITMGMETTNSPFFVVMNRDVYEGLTSEQQAAVDAAGKQLSLDGQKVQLTVAEKGIADFKATPGKEVMVLDEAAAAPFNKAADAVTAQAVAETAGGQAIIDALAAR